ncbi:Imm26 family immunity protein [Asticcacaulis sp. AND118]|uniref:Imm26 family immunity protein n=1 Tax=Asticcacaulis sp. AND118 TaxID=2840468 RepID=UPI001CFFE1B3|nr:Imm26 family immunity protein [Asticcacaulis sp. AND118]UDF05627.1 immunity 26 domain-containing protein [Asticcacaulis sp. AND118]
MVATNFQYIKKSNKPLSVGDVFTFNVAGVGFLYGSVIFANIDFPNAPTPGSNLIYIYNMVTDGICLDLPSLKPNNLLLPPIWTNRMAWTKGFFQNIGEINLDAETTLRRYCFYSVLRKAHVNEVGDLIPAKVEPCGTWGLASYRLIDQMVSDALGIERAREG